jgi:FMN phosphatase YigB (HAD superfamily)
LVTGTALSYDNREYNAMGKPLLVSFDLDGTLVDGEFTMWVWEIGIPELYARKHNLPLSEAVARVTADYEQVGDTDLTWYDIKHWFNHYELPGDWKGLLRKHRNRIRLFPEVKEVVSALSQHYELIITSNAAREFVEMEVLETGIGEYFTRIFSATSDFRQVKKTPQFYRQLSEIMGRSPIDIRHVGDHYEFDYLVPRAMGVQAYFLDRKGTKPEGNHSVKDLREFATLLR